MNIFINILVAFICLIIGYVLGSANISIPIGKLLFKQDPRDYGSHNCGATNCGRIWGKKYFFIVFFFDVFKTIAPLYLCWAILTFVPLNNGTYVKIAQQRYNGARVLKTSKKKTIKKYFFPQILPQFVAPQLCEP